VNDKAKHWCDAIRDRELTPDLSTTARHVAQNLGNYFKAYGRAFPGRASQARETGYHVSTIARANRELVGKNYLIVVEHGGSKRGEKRIATHYLPSLPDHVLKRLTGSTEDPVRSAPSADNAPTGSRALSDCRQSATPISNEPRWNRGERKFPTCEHNHVFDESGESSCGHGCMRLNNHSDPIE
jgi:hypothetical protein